MTTEIEITSEKTMPQNDAIRFAYVGDHFDLRAGGNYIVKSKTFYTNYRPIWNFLGDTTIKLVLERDESTYLLDSTVINPSLERPPALVGDICMTPEGTFRLDSKNFEIRANGLYIPDWWFEPANETADSLNPEHQNGPEADGDPIWVTLEESIKLSHLGDFYNFNAPNKPPKYHTVRSKTFISHKMDGSVWSIETIVEDPEHQERHLSTHVEARELIVPYAKAGDNILLADGSRSKVAYKVFSRSSSSQHYSFGLRY